MPSQIHLATVNYTAQSGVYTSYQDIYFGHQYQKLYATVPVRITVTDVALVVVRHAVSTAMCGIVI